MKLQLTATTSYYYSFGNFFEGFGFGFSYGYFAPGSRPVRM